MPSYQIPKLDPRLFKGYFQRGNISQQRVLESPNLPIIEDIYKGKDKGLEGGIYRKLKGQPFDEKCLPDPDIINKLNIVKSDIVSYFIWFSKGFILPFIGLGAGYLLTSKKKRLASLNKSIGYFILKCHRTLIVEIPEQNVCYSCFFEDTSLYCDFARELLKFLTILFEELGLTKENAYGLAEIFILFIEYDNAYRLRIQDIFSETTKDKIWQRKELKRLGKLYAQREKTLAITDKMQSIINLLTYSLWLPSFKKAFKKALNEIDFTKFQFDKADRYHCLTWKPYDFFGESLEKRIEKYMEYHKNQKAEFIRLETD